MQLWERYCSWQRLPAAAAAAGAELLRGLLAGSSGLGEGAEQQHTSIQFQAVEVEGYFRLVPGFGAAKGLQHICHA